MPAHFARSSSFGSTSIVKMLRGSAVAAALLLTPAITTAQSAPDVIQPDVENGRFQFEGVLTRPELVRALPGDNFYPTVELKAGAKVIVVGTKNNWLKILPPQGSFSYVQKAFVQAHGDGKQGKATAQLIVRAGSSLQPLMWVTQAKLEKGEPVEIIGEEEQYFKIKPPNGAYLYVATDAVKPTRQVTVSPAGEITPVAEVAAAPTAGAPTGAAPGAAAAAAPIPTGTPVPLAPVAETPAARTPPTRTPPIPPTSAGAAPAAPRTDIPRPPLADLPDELATGPETRPTLTGDPAPALIEPPLDAAAKAAAPASRPVNPLAAARPLAPAEAVANLQSLEQQFTAASQLPLAEQPLSDLVDGYQRVGDADGIGDMTRRIVETRLSTLKLRLEARNQLLAMQAAKKDNTEALTAQRAESNELRQRVAQNQMQSFTAVGTIRPSSLQVSKTPIFRLTDPQTGRTLAYVWATDAKILRGDGQFVGVRGEVNTDARFNFKVITPTAVQALDPQKLYAAYSADITPPSLLPKATATTVTPGE